MRLNYGLATRPGHLRDRNADALLAQVVSRRSDSGMDDLGLFVVMDTYGSEVNSIPIVTKCLLQHTAKAITNWLCGQAVDWCADLVAAFQDANRCMLEDKDCPYISLTAAVVTNQELFVAHVGATALLVIEESAVTQITQPLRMCDTMLAMDLMTWDEFLKITTSNYVVRGVGMSEDLEVDSFALTLKPKSQVLLYSSGLAALWSPTKRTELLNATLHTLPIQAACEYLVRLADEEYGRNVSALAVEYA